MRRHTSLCITLLIFACILIVVNGYKGIVWIYNDVNYGRFENKLLPEIKIVKLNSRMHDGRFLHNSSILCSGNVLITGGYDPDTYNKNTRRTEMLNTTEIYNYKSKKFYKGPKMNLVQPIKKQFALPNCNVLIIGPRGIETFDYKKNKFILWKNNLQDKYQVHDIDKMNFTLVGDNVLATGGLKKNGTYKVKINGKNKILDNISASSEAYVLETDKKNIRQIKNMPVPKSGHASYVYNNFVYLLFGKTDPHVSSMSKTRTSCSEAIIKYNMKNEKFTLAKEGTNVCKTEEAFIFPADNGGITFHEVSHTNILPDSIDLFLPSNNHLITLYSNEKKLLKTFNNVTFNGKYYIIIQHNKVFIYNPEHNLGAIKSINRNFYLSNYVSLKDGSILITGNNKDGFFRRDNEAYMLKIK